MSKKGQKVVKEDPQKETEILEATKELENDTKLNNEMLKLEKEIRDLTEANKALQEKVNLANAEAINYRRRKDEEMASSLKYANQDLITELLPIVDTFEKTVNSDDTGLSEELKKYLTGFRMVYQNLKAIFAKYGVEEINRVGEVFDPKLEQALLTDSKEELEDEVILEVLQKGYKLKDRIIRPASVKINQK